MNQTAQLPTNRPFFSIRFESIGGLGANAAGQILARAAVVKMGLNAAQFSSYGSEKKGSLVRSFLRLAPPDRPIRTSAPVDRPDVIAAFHATLLRMPATFAGLRGDGTFIFNAPKGAAMDELARLPRTARVLRVDALGIAVKEKSRPNAVILGTLSGAFPFLNGEQVLAELSDEFKSKHPAAVACNEAAFKRGAAEFEEMQGVGEAEGDLPPLRPEPVLGYDTQAPGGIIPEPGNTVWNDNSPARSGFMPYFNSQRCIHCGMCDLVCPDYCLVWEDGEKGGLYQRELKGIDYRYCKGCLQCVETCPASAMTKRIETPGLAERARVPLYPDLID
jgi:pyruvate ferredoxin oxidoreductase gamma subunit